MRAMASLAPVNLESVGQINVWLTNDSGSKRKIIPYGCYLSYSFCKPASRAGCLGG